MAYRHAPPTHPTRPPPQALIHGLNRHYYSIGINYRKNELEEGMLLNLNKKAWSTGLTLADYQQQAASNTKTVEEMKSLASRWGVRGAAALGGAGEQECWRGVPLLRLTVSHAAPRSNLAHLLNAPTHRYNEAVAEEGELSPEQRVVANVGKMDARKHLAAAVTDVMGRNIDGTMGTLLDTIIF